MSGGGRAIAISFKMENLHLAALAEPVKEPCSARSYGSSTLERLVKELQLGEHLNKLAPHGIDLKNVFALGCSDRMGREHTRAP